MRSTNKKHLFSIVVAILLVAALVVGCSKSSAPPPAPAPAPAPSGGSSTPETPQGPAFPTDVAGMGQYDGADRQEQLLAAAKQESGKIMLYTSIQAADMEVLQKKFKEMYGIDVEFWRAGSENILQRIVTEAQAGRFDFDVVETNGPELEALHREGLLTPVKSPNHADLIKEAIQPHGDWVGTRLNIFAQAYNTNKFKAEDAPKTWEGFLDPKFKGIIGVEAEDIDWFAGVIKEMGEEKGIQFFKDLVATNGLSLRKGHTLLTELVASGEVPVAMTVYNYKAEQLKNDGAPLEWFVVEPAIARANGVAVSKNPKNPASAILFYDFMIGEAQALLAEMSFVPTSDKVDTTLNDMDMRFVDAAIILDEFDKWEGLWNEIIAKK